MFLIETSKRRLIKRVCLDRDGLPAEEIIRELGGLPALMSWRNDTRVVKSIAMNI
jgi:hypothetical protein